MSVRRLLTAAVGSCALLLTVTALATSAHANVPSVPAADRLSPAELLSVCGLSPDDYWAVGARLIDHGSDQRNYAEHWDGSSWQPVQTPAAPGSFNDLFTGVTAISSKDVWAVGWEQTPAIEVAPFAEHWNGHGWTVMRMPLPKGARDTEIWGADSTSGSDVWAVGDAGRLRVTQPLVEHWDGARWSIARPPSEGVPKNATLQSVTATASGDVWAVGSQVIGHQRSPFVEHFDGRTWSVVAVPLPRGEAQGALGAVSSTSSKDVWAVGLTLSEPRKSLVEHWDGTHWRVVPTDMPGSGLILWDVAALGPKDVWVLGSKSLHHPIFEHWDGSTFTQVPEQVHADFLEAFAFTSPGDAMAVGFADARSGGQQIVPAHALWNGHRWRTVLG